MAVIDVQGKLLCGQYLRTGQYIVAPNGSFFAVLQGDGSFAVYNGTSPSDNRGLLWSSGMTPDGRAESGGLTPGLVEVTDQIEPRGRREQVH